MGMFLATVGVNWVPFWPTAMLWLRGPVGVAVGVVEVGVVAVVSGSVAVAVEVAVVRVDGPETEGAWRCARELVDGSDGWVSWRATGAALAAADAAWERRVGRTRWRSFILLILVDLLVERLTVGFSAEPRVGCCCG